MKEFVGFIMLMTAVNIFFALCFLGDGYVPPPRTSAGIAISCGVDVIIFAYALTVYLKL